MTLEIYKRNRPRVVISDIKMVSMDRLKLTLPLKENRLCHCTQDIFMIEKRHIGLL